ncbi:MAG TPA: acetyl-CoA synthase subunit delta, partial [Methanosarcinales archaeon]|nr:acetyl-CoA synthase subunit delta [Methanosarcinales archaeon]
MSKTITLSELNKLLENVLELQDVEIEGEIDIELAAGSVDHGLAQAVGYEIAQIATRLSNIAGILGYQVEEAAPIKPAMPVIPQGLIPASFDVSTVPEWKHRIEEVTLGATSSDGGTRKSTVTLGGEDALPYYFDAPMPHRNYISIDVFDMPLSMARAVRVNYEDVLENPAEWAKKAVSTFGADLVTVHLISTDPTIKDTPAS